MANEFIWRRLQSLMGLWLIVFLFVHMIINSQAALWMQRDDHAFSRMANALESLPYLLVIESVFLGIPFLVHMIWGVRRLLQAKTNSSRTDGSSPSMVFGRNKAFVWQRLTSWILLVGVIGHVVHMRFILLPTKMSEHAYVVTLTPDKGLESLAKKFDVELKEVDGKMIATAPTMGDGMLLMVRDVFKSPLMCILYSIFVLATAFHAFNGLWTALITWGVLLSYRSQKAMIPIAWVGVAFFMFLGLASIWGSYWISV